MIKRLMLGGHRGFGCTDHDFYQGVRDIKNLPVENTFDSIKAAFEAGADYIETDAVMSGDGRIFALHNVVPKDHFFGDVPKQLLNQMDFSTIQNHKTGRFKNGEICDLASLLELIAQIDPKTLPWAINIEIKGVQGSGQNYEDNNYLNNLAKIVRESSLPIDRILWSSFSLANVIAMSHEFPESRFGMLFGEKPEALAIYANHGEHPHHQYLPFNIDQISYVSAEWDKHAHPTAKLGYLHPEIMTVDKAVIDAAAQNSMGINCWALFEKFDDNRANIYQQKIDLANAENVSFTVITDYLPEMQKLGLTAITPA